MVPRVVTTILQAFAIIVLTVRYLADADVQLSETFGGPHGNEFSDEASVTSGQTVSFITIRSGDRVDSVSLGIAAPTATTFSHGGAGGIDNTLTLASGEYITSMEAHWGEKDGHTRIFYLNFGTSAGNSVSGGTQTDSTGSVSAPAGYQLGGFYGRDGDEIDLLGAIWSIMADEGPGTVAPANISNSVDDDLFTTSSSAGQFTAAPTDTSASVGLAAMSSASSGTTAQVEGSSNLSSSSQLGGSGSTAPTPASSAIAGSGSAAPASDMSDSAGSVPVSTNSAASGGASATITSGPAIQLSETFGGPHGNEFSDQPAACSGQTITSITVRGDKRVDGITLVVSTPTAQTFTHGGTGGTDNTLTLGSGEYITSMEAHWGQKDDHTRIFYLSFVTSAGNSVSGGTQTDEKGTVTAPDGYQLGGFFGRDGDEIDLIGLVWTSIKAVEDTTATTGSGGAAATVSDEDIVLSQLYGGPHGIAFSDIDLIKFSQVATSITVRSADRVDAVTLNVGSPTAVTMNHGGSGGTDNTLTLGDGEFISSMEAHWGKKTVELASSIYIS